MCNEIWQRFSTTRDARQVGPGGGGSLDSHSGLTLSPAHTVTVDGKYYAWGQNRNGQLGTGDLVQQLAPTRVVPPNQARWTAKGE